MHDVTTTAEPTVDIWGYVAILVKENIVAQYTYVKNLVEYVYRNDSATFEHVLLPTEHENVFIVVVVDLVNKSILGHYKLDLNELYRTS